MSWPIGKCLVRTGVPAALLFVGRVVIMTVRSEPDLVDEIISAFWLFVILWLAASALFWVLTRIMPSSTGGS